MHVDLTKPDLPEPDESAAATAPGAAAAEPQPEAVLVEKEPVRLTAREELTLPAKAFAAAVAAGSPVLTRLILTALWRGVRAASQTQRTPAPRPAPKKPAKVTNLRKDEPADDSDEDEGGQEDKKTELPAKPAATASGLGDAAERFAMGVLVIGVACVMGGGLLAVAWAFLAPYAWLIGAGLIVAWCLAAAHLAPAPEEDIEDQDEEDTPVNDQENVAGEQPQEEDPAATRAGIWRFAEGAVAAGAADHFEEKGRGASVDTLLALLRKKEPLPGWGRKQMIAFLKSADIPVRDQVSFYVEKEVDGETKKVKKVCPGVHVHDLGKELGHTPRLPGDLVPDITPGTTPILTSVPDPDESVIQALDELSPGAPGEAPAEGRAGAA